MDKRLTISSADQREYHRLKKIKVNTKAKVDAFTPGVKALLKDVYKRVDNFEKGFRAIKVDKQPKEK